MRTASYCTPPRRPSANNSSLRSRSLNSRTGGLEAHASVVLDHGRDGVVVVEAADRERVGETHEGRVRRALLWKDRRV